MQSALRAIRLERFTVNTMFRSYAASALSSETVENLKEFLNPFEGGSVELKKDEGSQIAYVKLNNPERRNALSGKMMVDLHNIVTDLEKWTTGKGLILYSPGPVFCSGGDLTTVKQISDPESGSKMCQFMQHVTQRLLNLPLVSVALVSGKALGGGAEMTTSTDFRAMTSDAEVSFVQARMGGGTRLVKIVGRRNALKLLLTCEKINVTRAEEIGYVDYVVEDSEKALDEVTSWLKEMVSYDYSVTRAIKNVVTVAEYLPPLESLEVERSDFAPLWGGRANKEALSQNIKHK